MHISAPRTYTSFDATIFCITTSTGLQGWGESTPFGSDYIAAHARGVRAGIAEIVPRLIGLDPRRTDRVYDAMDAALIGHAHAKTAIDVACWDTCGKSVGLPRLPIISSIPADEVEKMPTNVKKHRAKGYIAQLLKMAGENPNMNAERIKTVTAEREQGEFYLIDGNGGLTVETALRMLQQLGPSETDFCLEALCATWECISLRERISIPVVFDELSDSDSSLIQMIADDAVDGTGLKISKAGSLTKARRHKDICIASGWLQVILEYREMVTTKTADVVGEGAFEVMEGLVTAPNAPGLGVVPRTEALEQPVASYS